VRFSFPRTTQPRRSRPCALFFPAHNAAAPLAALCAFLSRAQRSRAALGPVR
jgi:hypothetical protein